MNVPASPNYPSGGIGGIQATIVWEDYIPNGDGYQEALPDPSKCWCYLVVSATTPVGEIELIRSLLGIYSGDDRPILSHWKSTPGGIATGPLLWDGVPFKKQKGRSSERRRS